MRERTLSPFEKTVTDALRAAFRERDRQGYETSGIGQAFFRVWFKEQNGEALFFVFRQSLKVTNIQLGELIALISAHTTLRDGSPVQSLQFVSYQDFVSSVGTLIAAIPRRRTRASQAEWFARHYAYLLARTIVVDSFFGSCAVYVPYHLFVDLRILCGLSGYIHSCGRNVFIRNVGKASKQHFFKALSAYLARYSPGPAKILLTPFAHEDFRRETDDSTSDLEHLKLHVEKFFVGREHLVDVLSAVQAKFRDHLVVPDPGAVRQKTKRDLAAELRSGKLDEWRTMWLLSDHRVGFDGGRTNERYFMCYEQMFHNRNPFFIFDENKPGWVEHTTMPHTLAAAMLNITRPNWGSKKATIVDPFAGTGTTLFEAAKLGALTIVTSDKSALACRAAADNARFFVSSKGLLQRLHQYIASIRAAIDEHDDDETETVVDAADVAPLAQEIRSWSRGASFQLRSERRFFRRHTSLSPRIAFYLALRTNKRHAAGFSRRSEAWPRAFAREADLLNRQIEKLVALHDLVGNTAGTQDDVCVDYVGRFSRNVTLSPEVLRRFLMPRIEKQRPRDANNIESWLKRKSVDVVITDPPYGFNTDDDSETLARLYVNFLRGVLGALRDDGQLVICLPERSNIGKTPLGFQHHGIVIHQVLSLAREYDKEVMGFSPATPGRLFQPPYYWESDRALRRSILHFRFKRIVGF